MDIAVEPQTLRILKCTDQNLTFFTDPASPYQGAPPNVREIFTTEPNNEKSIKLANPVKQFRPRPGQTHICTSFFPSGTYYYTCKECCNQNQPGVTMCFCEPCWEESKHTGHSFKKVMASGGAYCDCGRQQRIKSESFCTTHSDKTDKVLDIPIEQQQQFTDYYTSLFLCAFYIKSNQSTKRYEKQIQVVINKAIETLCTGSLYYIRLVTKVFQKQVEINNEKRLILEWVLKMFKMAERMLFSLLGDNIFKVLIVKNWLKLTKQGWHPENLRLVLSEMYETDDIFFRLAQEGQFLWEKRSKYFELALRSEKGVELLKRFIQNQRNTLRGQQWLTFVLACINEKNQKVCPFLMKQKSIVETLVQCLLTGDYNNAVNMTADRKNSAISITSMLLLFLADGKLTNLEQLYQHQIIKNQIQGLERFLTYVIKNIRYFVFRSGSPKQNWLLVPLYLICKSPNKQKLLDQLWKGITEPDQQLRQDLIQITVSIYHMCAIIANSSIFFNQLSSQNPVEVTNLEQEKQNWMKSYLYENGETTRTEVLSMRAKGLFKFPNSSQIFKRLCTYMPNRDSFQYTSTQKYPNYSLRFKQERTSRDLASISSSNFRISDEYQFENKPEIACILQTIFQCEGFVNNLCGRWWDKYQKSRTVPERISFWKSSDLSYYYVLTLLYANVFSSKRNSKLQEEINKIKDNPETRNIICSLTSTPERIYQMLEIKQESSKNVQQSPEKAKSSSDDQKTTSQQLERKKLFAQKRLKLNQKYKSSAQKFLTQQKSQPSQSQNQCIICREPNKDNDKLMYICNFQKNSSISYCLFGEEDKSEITIASCFHMVHSQCFMGINKSGFDFNCPLCTRKSNIYLPTSHNDKKSIKRCGNLINAIEVVKHKNADFGSLLIVYLKHLIGSYGLNSLVSTEYYEKQRKNMRKIDHIVTQMAENLASSISQTEKQDFDEQYQQFEKQFELCAKEGLKLVQKLFSKTIYNKIFKINPIIDEALLQQAHDKIIPQQYTKITQILEQLTHHKIKSPQNMMENEQNKISISFKKLYPPASTNQFQNYSTQICNLCQKAPTTHVCLLCSKSFCPNCIKGQHTKQHSLNFLALELNTKKLSIRQLGGKVNGNHNIYFDIFMSSYEERIKYNSEQNYELNMPKMEKLLMSYILRTEIK